MKHLLPLFFLFVILGCKNDPKQDTIDAPSEPSSDNYLDSLKVSDKSLEQQKKTLDLKRREFIERKDHKEELENLVISKAFFKENELYTIDLEYPFINEETNPDFAVFNEFIAQRYLNTKSIENQLREEKRLCDSLGIPSAPQKRIVEYKIHNLNDRLISVLFYKENHYAGAAHPSYTFEALNFDLEMSAFMEFEDFFQPGSEEDLRGILNRLLIEKIDSGELYYDCWTISSDDFFSAKNNFLINDYMVEYYFDDCVICPSYTGTYSIELPLELLKPVLRRHKKNPLL